MSSGVLLASEGAAQEGGCHLVPWSGGSDCGFPAPDSTIFDFDPAFTLSLGNLTLHFTKPMIMLWLGVLIVVVVFTLAFRKAKIIPRGLQNVAEMGYLFVRDGIARDTIGKEGDKFVPLLFSFFFFIWVLNFFSVVPFLQFPTTSRFAIPLAFVNPRVGQSLNLVVAVLIYVVYNNLNGLSQAWVGQGRMSFAVGLTATHAAVLAIAAWLFWRRTSLVRLWPPWPRRGPRPVAVPTGMHVLATPALTFAVPG